MHDSQFEKRFSKALSVRLCAMGIGDENLGCPKLKQNNTVFNSVNYFVLVFFFCRWCNWRLKFVCRNLKAVDELYTFFVKWKNAEI